MLILGDDDLRSPKMIRRAHWNFPAMQMGSNGTARSFLIESTTERAFGNRAAEQAERQMGSLSESQLGPFMGIKGNKW